MPGMSGCGSRPPSSGASSTPSSRACCSRIRCQLANKSRCRSAHHRRARSHRNLAASTKAALIGFVQPFVSAAHRRPDPLDRHRMGFPPVTRWWRRTRSSTWGRRAGPCLSSVAVDSSGEVLGSDHAAPPRSAQRCPPCRLWINLTLRSHGGSCLRMRGEVAGHHGEVTSAAWPPATRQAAAVKLGYSHTQMRARQQAMISANASTANAP